MARVVLDSGAVVAWSRRDARVRAFIHRAIQNRDLLVVPSVVIAETTRGRPTDAPVNQVLKAIDVVIPISREIADLAARLLGVAGLDVTIDALVAAVAVSQGWSVLLTGDQRHMSALLEGQRTVTIHPV